MIFHVTVMTIGSEDVMDVCIAFFAGLFLGNLVGMLVVALCFSGKDD